MDRSSNKKAPYNLETAELRNARQASLAGSAGPGRGCIGRLPSAELDNRAGVRYYERCAVAYRPLFPPFPN